MIFHLTTFEVETIFTLMWLKEDLQLRVIFTNEVDVFTFVVDFLHLLHHYLLKAMQKLNFE